MKRGRKPSTKNDVAAVDNNSKAKKIKPAEDVKSSDAQDKIASLPLHGEYLPAKGYSVIPPLVNEMRQALVEVFQMVRNQKRLGDKASAPDIEESRVKGALLFVTLKKLNRLSHLYCKEARDQTQTHKQELDGLHLQLQNLKYEMIHLSKEISNCLQFQSSHDDIQLISEEEFYATAPPEISQPDVTKSDEHQQMMARLHWELKQRQKLTSQKDELQSEISSLEAEISQQQSVIDNLKPSLDKLLEASLPIQEYLQLPLDKKRKEHVLAELLPGPLYILYAQASAYSEAYTASGVKVSIHGDEEEARSFTGNWSNDGGHQSEDDSDSDMDSKAESSSRRKSQSKSSTHELKNTTKPHPLHVQIYISESDSCTISLSIQYIPLVGIACVNIIDLTATDDDDDCDLLDRETILHDLLLPGDNGETFPNPLSHYLMKQHGEKVLLLELKAFGIPYRWVQLLCGLDLLTDSPKSAKVNITKKNIDKIMVAIKKRISMRLMLQNEINKTTGSLEDSQGVNIGPQSTNLFPATFHSKMVRFKKLSREEALSHSEKFVDSCIFDVHSKANKFYLISFQLSDEQHKQSYACRLHCLMCITPAYPTVPPTFTLVLESQGQKKPHSHWMKAIEAEVNVHYADLLDDDDSQCQYLLARQLLKIQMCFDTLETTYPSDNREAFLPLSMFPRKHRGRDRMPAYQFASDRGMFIHRT